MTSSADPSALQDAEATTPAFASASRWPSPAQGLAFEICVAAVALTALVLAQLLLSLAIHGATYRGTDGGAIQANVYTAWSFGGVLNVTNLNPLQGLGSQLLPKNAWANPAFWPFALFDRQSAADLSSVVALALYALACYAMARCFDLPTVPSALAAELSILIFSPVLFIMNTPPNFSSTPADAVTYAPYMIAFGLLARLEPASTRRQFVGIAAGITLCLLYSIYCDPAFSSIAGASWSVAFAAVTLFAPHRKGILMRAGVLGACLAVLLLSGVALYLYTMSAYSARGEFPTVVDRIRVLGQATYYDASGNMRYLYPAFLGCWLLGLIFARSRVRLLVVAAVLSWCVYVPYAIVYLLVLDVPWLPPVPGYVEQALFILYMTAAVAGAWEFLRRAWLTLERLGGAALGMLPAARRAARLELRDRTGRAARYLALSASVAIVLLLPAKMALLAKPGAMPYAVSWPWADEPELVNFLADRVALMPGETFRGSVNFLTANEDGTIDELWRRGVPTLNEYSQTASGISLFFTLGMLKPDPGRLNRFHFAYANKIEYASAGGFPPNYWRASELLGVRYVVDRVPNLPDGLDPGTRPLTLPYHVPSQPGFDEKLGPWKVFELPHPNLGDYSPTAVVTRDTGAAIMATLATPGFDYAKTVVLTAPFYTPLAPAERMRLSVIRDGLQVAGRSGGTSMVVLPQQFSHCLQPADPKVRLARADLLLTGVVFSGTIDTDITFEYGLFSPWCRLRDLADLKALDLKLKARMPHLAGHRIWPSWLEAVERLKAAARGLNLAAP